MSVILEPSRDLDFPHLIPPGRSAICLLSISNTNTFAVDVKVMTTAPKRYLARPNKGRIEAGESLDVILHYQLPRTDEEREQHTQNQNKFLVESKMVSSNEKKASIFQRLSHARTGPKEPKVHKQELIVRTLPPMTEKNNEDEPSSSSNSIDGLPTYEDVVLSDMQSGNMDLISHVEEAQRGLDHLQMTINGLREALRHSEVQ